MRTNRHVSALPLSIVLVLGACGTQREQTAALPADLQKDLAVASASSGELAIAGQNYQRMRFVSGVEQTPTASKAPRPKAVRHVTRPKPRPQPTTVASNEVAPDPMAEMAQDEPMPTPVSTVEADAPEAPTVIAQAPVEAPSNEPMSAPSGTAEGTGNHGHGGGIGGILGGIIGAVVIRGGAGGIDHCDPRHDGRNRPTMGMPVYSGGVFGGVRRR